MNLFVFGLNHTTAPLDIRERASIEPTAYPQILKMAKQISPISGIVLLSTCNRTEIYLTSSNKPLFPELFGQILQLPLEIPSTYLYCYTEKEAIAHLFRVISGMNSMILGEYQIVGQVKQAFSLALEMGTTNTLLNKLFQLALETNKTVRTRTAISKGAVSVSYAASELCRRIFSSLTELKALLIGAGETGELACKHLQEAQLTQWWITNRTPKRGEDLAKRIGGKFIPLDQFPAQLSQFDLVITATASPIPLVTLSMIKSALEKRTHPLCLIDLSVPRNIEPSINTLDEIICYNVDDLQEIVIANIALRDKEAKRAESFIQDALQKFSDWEKRHHQGGDIQEILKKLETIRREELEKHGKKIKIEANQMEKIDTMTQTMMKRVLHFILTQRQESPPQEEPPFKFSEDELFTENEQQKG